MATLSAIRSFPRQVISLSKACLPAPAVSTLAMRVCSTHPSQVATSLVTREMKPVMPAPIKSFDSLMPLFSGEFHREIYSRILIEAARIGEFALVESLLSCPGIDVSCQDESGNTALHYAARANNIRMIELLLSKKPIVNQKNAAGETALIWAARDLLPEGVAALIHAGANVHLEDSGKCTALIHVFSSHMIDSQGMINLEAYNKVWNLLIAAGARCDSGTFSKASSI